MGLNFIECPKSPEGVKVKEVYCSTALSFSKLESDYALNPYTGCSHNCLYCYSPFVLRESREWGTFVDVKRNVPRILSKELQSKDGTVRIGSVTDPYQEIEKDYKVTRMCLEQLKRKGVPTIVQTKSDLVTRDIDIFKDMDVDVGLTITSLKEDFCSMFEPGAPGAKNRLKAAEKLMENGISTWVFIGPIMPFLNDGVSDLQKLVEKVNSIGINEVYIDKLNMRAGIWKKIENVLPENQLKRYKEVYASESDYFFRKKLELADLGKLLF